LTLLFPGSQFAEAGQPPQNLLFVDDSARAVLAAASVVTAGDPVSATGILVVANGRSLWDASPPSPPEKLADSERAPVLDPDALAGVEDRARVRSADENYYEANAYSYVLVQAHKTSGPVFAKSARTDLTFAHLFEEPQKYRGQVVHLEGRLLRLRRFDAP